MLGNRVEKTQSAGVGWPLSIPCTIVMNFGIMLGLCRGKTHSLPCLGPHAHVCSLTCYTNVLARFWKPECRMILQPKGPLNFNISGILRHSPVCPGCLTGSSGPSHLCRCPCRAFCHQVSKRGAYAAPSSGGTV